MKKNILLVEYSTSAIEVIQQILRDKIFDITVARSEEIAKDLLKNFRFDMVISETLLPKSHGFILSKYISENYPTTKIIIISDKLKQADYKKEALSQHGAHDFFEKPLPARQFRKRVLEILGVDEEEMVEMAFSSDVTTKLHILPSLEELAAFKSKKQAPAPEPESPKEENHTPIFKIDLD